MTALRDRGWAGDEELAAELEVALGYGPPDHALAALPVDLEEFSLLLEGGAGEGGGVVDRLSGEVWPRPAMEYAEETEDEPPDFEDGERWLYVGPEGSGKGYRDMENFSVRLTIIREVIPGGRSPSTRRSPAPSR